MLRLSVSVVVFILVGCAAHDRKLAAGPAEARSQETPRSASRPERACAEGGPAHAAGFTGTTHGGEPMQLGNFSVSLAVQDLSASRAFYEKLGFRPIAGDAAQNWLILQNGTATIGLFQGMFEKNTLTFNPGWDHTGQTLPEFEDVRDIQRKLRERGLTPVAAADETSTGPTHLMLLDPDGNPVLFDQHVPRPGE